MREINSMLAAYRKDPKSLAAPSIPARVLAFLDAGLEGATETASRRSDPFFACGSDKTFRCRNARGQSMTIMVWGNTDGWGMEEV